MTESITLSPERVRSVLSEQMTVLRWPLEEPHLTIGRGARLWVRETFWADSTRTNRRYTDGSLVFGGPIRGPMHKRLPHQMREIDSRLTLIVMESRIEHLHDIDQNDALASGVVPKTSPGKPLLYGMPEWSYSSCLCDPRDVFKKVWTEQYSPYDWVRNPWVERVRFIHFHANTSSISSHIAGQALHEQKLLDSRQGSA